MPMQGPQAHSSSRAPLARISSNAPHLASMDNTCREPGEIDKLTWGVIFLPFRYMKEKYPIVGKIPLLLPVFWVVRWFEGVFKKGRTIESMKAELSGMTAKNVKDYNTALKYVGLNFNFEE